MRSVLLWLILFALASSTARAEDLSAAREHYRRGATLYDLRRYKDAAHEYEKAYEAKDDPTLLFNIGQAYRLANEPAEAIASYRAYLRRMPEASNRIEVEVFIEELQKQLDQQKRAQEAKPIDTQVPPPALGQGEAGKAGAPGAQADAGGDGGRSKRVAGITLGVVGVALLAAGGAFAALTQQVSDGFTRPANPSTDRFDPALDARGRAYFAAELSSFAVGGAALITGVALYAVGRQQSSRVTAAPVLAPGRVGLALDVRF